MVSSNCAFLPLPGASELGVLGICVQLTSAHFDDLALCASKDKNKAVDGNQRLEMFLSRSGDMEKEWVK